VFLATRLEPIGFDVFQPAVFSENIKIVGHLGRMRRVAWAGRSGGSGIFRCQCAITCPYFRRKTLKCPKKKKQNQARNSKINRSTSTRIRKSRKRKPQIKRQSTSERR
jgi:hypothetical protein